MQEVNIVKKSTEMVFKTKEDITYDNLLKMLESLQSIGFKIVQKLEGEKLKEYILKRFPSFTPKDYDTDPEYYLEKTLRKDIVARYDIFESQPFSIYKSFQDNLDIEKISDCYDIIFWLRENQSSIQDLFIIESKFSLNLFSKSIMNAIGISSKNTMTSLQDIQNLYQINSDYLDNVNKISFHLACKEYKPKSWCFNDFQEMLNEKVIECKILEENFNFLINLKI